MKWNSVLRNPWRMRTGLRNSLRSVWSNKGSRVKPFLYQHGTSRLLRNIADSDGWEEAQKRLQENENNEISTCNDGAHLTTVTGTEVLPATYSVDIQKLSQFKFKGLLTDIMKVTKRSRGRPRTRVAVEHGGIHRGNAPGPGPHRRRGRPQTRGVVKHGEIHQPDTPRPR